MIENVLNTLASSTPELRARYLRRIKLVASDEAREVERRLASLVERDRSNAA
jgi:DNA-binding TFAR19-related protein (PDSD5 family)